MTTIATSELTFNNKVKAMIGNKKTTKKHVAGIGYVFYFEGGFVYSTGNGFEKQMVISLK